MDFKYCPECGAKLSEGFKFCPYCGYRLPQSAPKTGSATLQKSAAKPPVKKGAGLNRPSGQSSEKERRIDIVIKNGDNAGAAQSGRPGQRNIPVIDVRDDQTAIAHIVGHAITKLIQETEKEYPGGFEAFVANLDEEE